jgi:hypothetical protein
LKNKGNTQSVSAGETDDEAIAKRLQADADKAAEQEKKRIEDADAALAAKLQHDADIAAKQASTNSVQRAEAAAAAANQGSVDVVVAAAKRRRVGDDDASVGAVAAGARVVGAEVSVLVSSLPSAAQGEIWQVEGRGLDVVLADAVALRCNVVALPADANADRLVCLKPKLKAEKLGARLVDWNGITMKVLGAADVACGDVVHSPYRADIKDPLTEVMYQGTVYDVTGSAARRVAHVLFDDNTTSIIPTKLIDVRQRGDGKVTADVAARLTRLGVIDAGAIETDDE